MTPQEVVADMISLAPANLNHENISEATFFVDAVTVEAQPGACPIQ